MPIYLVTPLGQNFDKLAAAMESLPNDSVLPLQAKAGFLVSFEGTTVELSHHLGITAPERPKSSEVGPAMVTAVTSYYGRGPTTMWEWLKNRIERNR